MRHASTFALALLAIAAATGCGGSLYDPQDDLAWTLSPERQTVAPGQPAILTVRIESKADINAEVVLTLDGLPAGYTTTPAMPYTMPDTASELEVTVNVPPTASATAFTLTLTAMEVGGTGYPDTTIIQVSDAGTEPTFLLEVTPSEHTFTPAGGSPTITYYIRPVNGFVGDVSISVVPTSSSVIITSPPAPPVVTITGGGAGGTFVMTAGDVGPGPHDVLVYAVSGSITRTGTVAVTFASSPSSAN